MYPIVLVAVIVAVVQCSVNAVIIPQQWLEILKQVCKENEDNFMSPAVVRDVCTFSSASGHTMCSPDPMNHLMLPIIMWSPIEQFEDHKEEILCPKCSSRVGLSTFGWTNGVDTWHSPRLLRHVNSNVLLVSRIYKCTEGHIVYAHHQKLIETCSRFTIMPFCLWHSTGFTTEFMDYIQHSAGCGVSMLECERQLLNNRYITFSRIRKKFVMRTQERSEQCFPDFDSVTIWKDSPTRHSIAGCFLQRFWENEHLYTTEMRAGSTSEDKLWLSCDHTFASVANFGVFREIDGQWVDQYTGLFCVLNGDGEVLTWKLTKNLCFESVSTQLKNLQLRLSKNGQVISEFYIDNCCSWRSKLQEVFGSDVKVMLDVFHAVQRVTKKISKRHPFHQQCCNDLKLAFRDSSDRGQSRQKPTPDPKTLRQSMIAFQQKWEDINHNGVKVLSPAAINEIKCILKHIDRGCLSHINPGRGTNRNERLHKDLNKIITNSRYGIEMGYALLTCTFYHHNERIRANRHKRTERPITAVSLSEQDCTETFGLTTPPKGTRVDGTKDSSVTLNTDKASIHELDYQTLNAKMKLFMEVVSNCAGEENDDDDDDHVKGSFLTKAGSVSILYKTIMQHLIIKQMEKASKTAHKDNNIFFVTFVATVLQQSSTSLHQTKLTDDTDHLSHVLSQWNFQRVQVSGDGNCLFTSLSLAIIQLVQEKSRPIMNFLTRIGFSSTQLNVAHISSILRQLMVKEWLGDNSDYYQKFVTIDIRLHADRFLRQGQFSGDLGDLMVHTLSNILRIPIVLFTSNPNLPVICVTPTTTVDSIEPLYLAYSHEGAGHYDYVIPQARDVSSLPSQPAVQPFKLTKCYCGIKKGFMGTPCISDMLGNCRCPCARKGEPCKTICKCKNCSNRNGSKPPTSSTRIRGSYATQEQPLSGRKGSDFLKAINEEHSDGSLSCLEKLIIFAIIMHFMLQGYDVTAERIHHAFDDIFEVATGCTFIELPIFKRSQQYIARYLNTVHHVLSLLLQIHGNCSL